MSYDVSFERKLLADSPGWYDYFINISDEAQIPDTIKPDFGGLTDIAAQVASAKKKEFYERIRMFLLCAMDTLTMPLTIISALEDISFDKPHLNVYLLGASHPGFLALSIFEEILHLVPQLKSLHITADGRNSWKEQLKPINFQCCPICTSSGRCRSIASYRGVYHDFAKTSEYIKPDLVVAFNTGWIDGPDPLSHWRPSIELFVASGVPALFTVYNANEAWNELTGMKALNHHHSRSNNEHVELERTF